MLMVQFYYITCLTLVDLVLPISAAPLPPLANKLTVQVPVLSASFPRSARSTFSSAFLQRYSETTEIPSPTEQEGTEGLDNIEWEYSPIAHVPLQHAYSGQQRLPLTQARSSNLHGSHTGASVAQQHGSHTAPVVQQHANNHQLADQAQSTTKPLDPTATHAQQKPISIMRSNKASLGRSHTPAPTVQGGQKTERSLAEIQRLTEWLEDFGYLEEQSNSGAVQPPAVRLNAALRKLQRYANISVTGQADDATMAILDKPRCGEKDFQPVISRHKRYILLNRRWERGREIDIQFRNYTASMTVEEQESILQYVIDQWNSAANARLVFHPNGEHVEFPEINIHHTRYDNRGRPFGPYGVLAYAALPRDGDMYFDDTERWAELHRRYPFTFSYKSVALHELGHSLGLAHSNNPSAVMYAFYGPTRLTLTPDDIAGAAALFGPN